MIFSHKDYLTYELPNDWCSEDEEENLLIYNPNGEGAITVSFFNILELRETLDEHISIMAKKFITTHSFFTVLRLKQHCMEREQHLITGLSNYGL